MRAAFHSTDDLVAGDPLCWSRHGSDPSSFSTRRGVRRQPDYYDKSEAEIADAGQHHSSHRRLTLVDMVPPLRTSGADEAFPAIRYSTFFFAYGNGVLRAAFGVAEEANGSDAPLSQERHPAALRP